MSDVKKALNAETKILQGRVKELYEAYYAKIKFILDNDVNTSTISTVEELASELNDKVTMLEKDYVKKVIIILGKEQ
ncbi:MAG: hypothetical protein LBF58_06630 [Deltaproteobacteria bacterium]|nr:hypothetical protein [Deltaproteobacteria bacterium]